MEENSYLRVYRTNITNHLPEGVSEASLVQAGSVESEQALSLQRSWEQRPQAHAVSGGQNPVERERERGGGNPGPSRRQEHRKRGPPLLLLGAAAGVISNSPLGLL